MPTATDRREAEELLLEPGPPGPLAPLMLVAGLVLAVLLVWAVVWVAAGPF